MTSEGPDVLRVVALATDLMDRSRIQEAAGDAVTVELFRAADRLWTAVDEQPDVRTLVLLDLTRPGALASLPATRPQTVTVIGYGPHVDDELLASATAAGVDEVLPRSQFFRRLPAIVGHDA